MTEETRNVITHILKKTERIASAIYLVTGGTQVTSELRTFLRTNVLNAISDSHTVLMADSDFAVAKRLAVLKDIFLMIMGVLEVGRDAKYLSDMNVRIVADEIRLLIKKIESVENVLNQRVPDRIDRSYFVIPEMPQRMGKEQEAGAPRRVGEIRDERVSTGGDLRRSQIISILRERPMLTVREIQETPFFAGKVSEKTIQRELVSLVEEGSVKRMGERRWSRYVLPEIVP